MQKMMRGRGALATMLMFGLVVACSDSTGPEDFNANNAEEVAASVETVAETMAAPEDAFKSLELAMGFLGGAGAFNAVAEIRPGHVASAAAWRELTELDPAAFFPSNHLGVTFVYHHGEGHYIPSDRTGAPENGIRVIYYAMDPITERPAEPLVELGYIDLTDESMPSSERLGILVVSTSGDADVTLADYYLDLSWTETQTSFSVTGEAVGFLSDGTNQLDFDLSQTLSGSEVDGLSMSMDHTLSLPNQDVSVNVIASAGVSFETEELSDLDITFTIQHGDNEVVLDATVAFTDLGETIDGSITFNGEVVANISGSTEHPTFTRPDGTELSTQEVEALRRIFEAVGDLFDFVENIFSAA